MQNKQNLMDLHSENEGKHQCINDLIQKLPYFQSTSVKYIVMQCFPMFHVAWGPPG